jgi:hypothetical protein
MNANLSPNTYRIIMSLLTFLGVLVAALNASLVYTDTHRYDYTILCFLLWFSIFCGCTWLVWRDMQTRFHGAAILVWWRSLIAIAAIILAPRWLTAWFSHLSFPENSAVTDQLQLGKIDIFLFTILILIFLISFYKRNNNTLS